MKCPYGFVYDYNERDCIRVITIPGYFSDQKESVSDKIKIPDPSQDIKTNNPTTSQSQPSEINFKLNKNKNTRKSGHTSPSPSVTKKKRKAIQQIASFNRPDPNKEPRPHPIMQDPEFQERYKKFLEKNGLKYGTSEPRKSALWLQFWEVELKKCNEGGMENEM